MKRPRFTLRDLFWLVAVLASVSAEGRAAPPDSSSVPTKRATLLDPTEEDWKRIKSPENIRWLDLHAIESEDSVDDENIGRIGAFSNLEVLLLACPKLTDKALKPIANLKKLRLIAIYGSSFSEEGLQQLARLPNVEVIAFCEVAVSEQAIATLRGKLPRTEIESVRIAGSSMREAA